VSHIQEIRDAECSSSVIWIFFPIFSLGTIREMHPRIYISRVYVLAITLTLLYQFLQLPKHCKTYFPNLEWLITKMVRDQYIYICLCKKKNVLYDHISSRKKKTVQITKRKTPSEEFHLPISLQRKARYWQISNNNNSNNRKQKKNDRFSSTRQRLFFIFS